MKKLLLALTLLTIVFSGCRKETDFEAFEFGYEYFPNFTGSFIEYRVEHITHGIDSDTSIYFMREFVAESFLDNQNHPATMIERSVRNSITEPYQIEKMLVQKRTQTSAQRFEDNQRFVVLNFPLRQGHSWDGNAYNTNEPWEYMMLLPGIPHQVGPFTFDETITIRQRDNVNLVEQQIAWEVYAKDIGLIEKYYKNITFQNFELSGVEFHWKIIGFGSN